jgi:hypothetical protein
MLPLCCSFVLAQDRTVRSLLRDAGRIAVHPMNRNVAAIATEGPEGAPLGFRSGIPDTLTTDEEQVGGGGVQRNQHLATARCIFVTAVLTNHTDVLALELAL